MGEKMKMGEEGEKRLSFVTLRDFKERGIKIDRQWNCLEALAAVAILDYEKEKEERIKKNTVKSSNWDCRFGNFERGSSSRTCDTGKYPVRVSNKEESKKPIRISFSPVLDEDMDFKNVKKIDIAAATFGNESSSRNSDQRTPLPRVFDKQREKALKKPVTNSILDDLYSKQKSGFVTYSRNKLLGDGDDEEWAGEFMRRKKKSKRDNHGEQLGTSKSNYKKLKIGRQLIVLKERLDLPTEFRARIEQMNGSKIYLVIQKGLFYSDISDTHARLSIPVNQVVSTEFLTDDEKRGIEGCKINVKLIEPSLQVSELRFTKWKMPKGGGKYSYNYALISGWKNVKNKNRLQEGDTVQVWSFRNPEEKLCLALVLVRRVSELSCC